MKKIVLLLVPLLFVILLAGCSGKKTLTCTANNETIKMVYDKEKVLEAYEDGVKLSDTEVQTINAQVEALGGMDKYVEFIENIIKSQGGSCKK